MTHQIFTSAGLVVSVSLLSGCGGIDALDTLCDDTQCVSVSAVSANISAALDKRVVGYVSFIGDPFGDFVEYGQARTMADSPAAPFISSTRMHVASVSKIATALAALIILKKNGVTPSTQIGSYLPSYWTVPASVQAITFQQLLSYSSGITADGADVPQTDGALQAQFSLPIISPQTRSYSNYDFAIFRILLPIIDKEVSRDAADPTALANAYIALVQKYVFEPVGLHNIDCKPPAPGVDRTPYAYSYGYPGNLSGWDSGDLTLQCGAYGWYLSARDLVLILTSLNDGDGSIIPPDQFTMMENLLGWDQTTDTTGYRYVEKQGDWGPYPNNSWLHTSIALFGPGVIGVLLINSDIAGTTTDAGQVLHDAYVKALRPKM